MKTIVITWLVTFGLYLLSNLVYAGDEAPADHMRIWSGFNKSGSVCIEIQDSLDGTPAKAELWLVNDSDVEWFEDAEGYTCLNIELSEETVLHAVTYDPGIEVKLVEDKTNNVNTAI